jgi:hypothetical protein
VVFLPAVVGSTAVLTVALVVVPVVELIVLLTVLIVVIVVVIVVIVETVVVVIIVETTVVVAVIVEAIVVVSLSTSASLVLISSSPITRSFSSPRLSVVEPFPLILPFGTATSTSTPLPGLLTPLCVFSRGFALFPLRPRR